MKLIDSIEIGRMWEKNAELWTRLAREGFDIYRDYVSTPGFFSILPNIKGLVGLDVGCGEGHNTRLLARKAAKITGIDISSTFIQKAKEFEAIEPLGIEYIQNNAVQLDFEDASFDFVTSFCSLMDIPELELAVYEIWRVLKPGGFLQFSITHPCFWSQNMTWIEDGKKNEIALACSGYFKDNVEISDWVFGGLLKDNKKEHYFTTALFKRTLSYWVNLLVETGFVVEKMLEPRPKHDEVLKHDVLKYAEMVAYFLIIRVRKLS